MPRDELETIVSVGYRIELGHEHIVSRAPQGS